MKLSRLWGGHARLWFFPLFGECATISESVQQFRRVCNSFGASAALSERVQPLRRVCRIFWSVSESVQHFGECAARLAYIHRIPGLSTKVWASRRVWSNNRSQIRIWVLVCMIFVIKKYEEIFTKNICYTIGSPFLFFLVAHGTWAFFLENR